MFNDKVHLEYMNKRFNFINYNKDLSEVQKRYNGGLVNLRSIASEQVAYGGR